MFLFNSVVFFLFQFNLVGNIVWVQESSVSKASFHFLKSDFSCGNSHKKFFLQLHWSNFDLLYFLPQVLVEPFKTPMKKMMVCCFIKCSNIKWFEYKCALVQRGRGEDKESDRNVLQQPAVCAGAHQDQAEKRPEVQPVYAGQHSITTVVSLDAGFISD